LDIEFICLSKLGVGSVLVRHTDIITMELTPMGFTRIEFGYGEHLIVEETPIQILNKIRAAQELSEQSVESTIKEPINKESK
jgi:hypothetical protein